tara:strand:+ start:2531 stop:2800 length:270 start_codon:yes stop_codon:yes gene_type:complete
MISVLIVLQLGFTIYLLFELKNTLLETIEDLDSNLARALQGTIAEIVENGPDINPFQQLILEWVRNGPQSKVSEIIELPRDDNGQFKAE